ncbi:unnamed protein product [Alopecurus aequalis]
MACTVPYYACAAPTAGFQPCHRASRSQLSPAAQPFQPRATMVQWQRPPVGWYKLNFDGSVQNHGSGRASIGGVIRDWHGRVLIAFGETTEHASVGKVEARALVRGLELALGHFMGRLVVEGDDKVLVQLLCGEETQTRIPQALQDEILALLVRFEACEVQHVFREGNQVADALCRVAYQRPGLWYAGGMLPLCVLEKARDDANGVAHQRIRKPMV